MTVYWKNPHHAQKLQKQAFNKVVKLKRYVPCEKVWLDSKYVKVKQNLKLKAKIFEPFYILY